jgi:hypothetical protein
MNKISFIIPNQTTNINVNPNINKIEDSIPFELTNVTKPKMINNITDYIKIAPNVYIFCNGIK